MGTPTTKHPAVRHPRQEPVAWGSKLTPEEREWQINKLLPAIIATLRAAADAANAAAGRDAAGKPIQ
ncbi:MAG: hypothetical protein M3R02_20690 [Chloroflexota bacterium]|nr:hypothetical protein [Chloroflexota bacterium]